MPLFKMLPFGRSKGGQLQEVMCPRCKEVIEPEEEVSSYGNGPNERIVEGNYNHECGYSVFVRETYPIINYARESERHIP